MLNHTISCSALNHHTVSKCCFQFNAFMCPVACFWVVSSIILFHYPIFKVLFIFQFLCCSHKTNRARSPPGNRLMIWVNIKSDKSFDLGKNWDWYKALLTCCWVLSHAHEFLNILICRGRRGNRPWSNFAHESLCMHCGYFKNLFFAVNIFTISSSTGIPDCATSQVQWLPPWPLAPPLIASVASPSVVSPSVAFPSVKVSPLQTVTDKSSHCHRRRVLTDKYLGRQMLTLCHETTPKMRFKKAWQRVSRGNTHKCVGL